MELSTFSTATEVMDNWDIQGSKMIIEGDDLLTIFNTTDYYNYSYNESTTCCVTAPCSPYIKQSFNRVFLPIFYSFIFILGLIGNGMVVAVLFKYKQSMAVTEIYILHLAIADILLILTLPFWAAKSMYGWVFGTAMCKLIGASLRINFYCGIFLLACISFERYLSIVHAIQMYNKRKTISVTVSCLLVWSLCLYITIPDFILLESKFDDRSNSSLCIHNYDFQSAKYWRIATRFFYHIVGFFIPLLVMIYCYALIIRTLRHSHGFQKQKAIHVIIAVVIAFFLCWMPYNLILFIDTLYEFKFIKPDCDTESGIDISLAVTICLGYFHSCLNPVLYAFVSVKFRNKFLELLNSVGCLSQEFIKSHMKPYRVSSTWSETGETSYSGL